MEKPLSPWQVVEKLRANKGISKKLLADKLQINYNYLVDLLNGRYQTNVDDEKIRIISSTLDIPIKHLLDELHDIHHEDPVSATDMPEKKLEPETQLDKIPVFRIISGSKIDASFNQSRLWAQKGNDLEFIYAPTFKSGPDNPAAKIAIKLEDHSLFPPCPSGSTFIVDTTNQPRTGNIVLVVLKNYRAWIIEMKNADSPPDGKFIFRPYHNDYETITLTRPDVLCIYPVIWIHPA